MTITMASSVLRKILFIINPAGHSGDGAKVWDELQFRWPAQIDVNEACFTVRQGHAREIATSAVGYDILATVGGDGTVGEIITGILAQPEPHPKLAIIPTGTDNNIVRNVDI